MFDVAEIRTQFPILHQDVHGRPLVYLDNSATTQKPRPVIEAVQEYYENTNSNVHRGGHYLGEQASERYEGARETVKDFINAHNAREVIITRGATESINLVAQCFIKPRLREGDEVVITEMEHHANLVPWQMICQEKGAYLKTLPVNDDGSLATAQLINILSERTRFLAISEVSNVLGTVTPIRDIAQLAHARDIPVLVDGAQGIQHHPVDVKEMDCDFYTFSGHKIYAETGIGVLWGKENLLAEMTPWQYGGGMISSVDFAETSFAQPPLKFEAGTQNICGAVSLKAAIDYLNGIGMNGIVNHEQGLLAYATDRLGALEGLTIYGTASPKNSVLSFTLANISSYDAALILDKMGVAVRSGHHCAQPLMKRLGINGTIRASFALYNCREEVDTLVEGVQKAQQMLS